jgi:hypothetical protein
VELGGVCSLKYVMKLHYDELAAFGPVVVTRKAVRYGT